MPMLARAYGDANYTNRAAGARARQNTPRNNSRNRDDERFFVVFCFLRRVEIKIFWRAPLLLKMAIRTPHTRARP